MLPNSDRWSAGDYRDTAARRYGYTNPAAGFDGYAYPTSGCYQYLDATPRCDSNRHACTDGHQLKRGMRICHGYDHAVEGG